MNRQTSQSSSDQQGIFQGQLYFLLFVPAVSLHRPDIARETIRVTGVFASVQEKLAVEYYAEVSASARPGRFVCLSDPMLTVW